MVWTVVRSLGARLAGTVGSSTAAAGAAGAAGGVLLDDVPLLSQLDPTESGNQGIKALLLPLGLVFAGLLALGTLFNINLGGGN
ncbi:MULTISPECIES: hypothetical protein [Salinibaculum]|uniref:hypothetical protein n=1 Tax=Salinibaculum TaxID=2732368 RepID=UPI0030CD07AC